MICLFVLVSSPLFATHNRAGEITFNQLSDNTIEAFVTTYTKTSSIPADRDSITLCWGDNYCERLVRINGPDNNGDGIPDGEILPNDYKRNIYRGEHSYSELGTYTIFMQDPNRNGGILNVNFPNSDQIQFCVEATVDLTLSAPNSSPVLLELPIDVAFVGQPFIHIPNAFDLEGDSIAYELVPPKSAPGIDVPNYLLVDAIAPGSNNTVSFDETTGVFIWDAPQREGEYNIAIKIKSYRNDALIDYVIRDMQILVKEEDNLIPVINASMDNSNIVNVQIGDTVNISLTMSDMNQSISVNSSSGLYDNFEQTANFTATANGSTGSIEFEWIVKPEHLRDQPYQVVFKATDEFGLANYTLFRFKTNDQVSSINAPIAKPILLNLFPNPTTELLSVQMEESISNATYIILNTQGQILKSGRMNASITEIDIRQLKPATYIFQVWDGKQRLNKPFVIVD